VCYVSDTAVQQLVAVSSFLTDDIGIHIKIANIRVWVAVDRRCQIVDVDADTRRRYNTVVEAVVHRASLFQALISQDRLIVANLPVRYGAW